MLLPLQSVPPRNFIAAIGSALVDICLLEDDDFLAQTGAQKGGMQLVEHHFIRETLQKSFKDAAIIPGGSACNTILGIGKLSGNARFIGKRVLTNWDYFLKGSQKS